MSEREFESYLNLLARFLKLSPQQRAAIEKELRAHLEERLEELRERGYSREEAVEQALAEFGDAAGLADDFAKATRGPIIRRRIMQTSVGTIAAAAAIALVFTFLLPENRPGVPERPGAMAEVNGDETAVRPMTPPTDQAERARLVAAERVPALEALEKEVSIDVEDATLAEVFQQFEEQAGVKLVVYWGDRPEYSRSGTAIRSAADEGDVFVADRAVTFRAADTSVRAALRDLSDALPTALSVRVRREALDITAAVRWNVDVRIDHLRRLYDVRDLLAESDRTLGRDSPAEREERLIRLIHAGGVGAMVSGDGFDDYVAWQFTIFDGALSVRPASESMLADHARAERLLVMIRNALEHGASPVDHPQAREARLVAAERVLLDEQWNRPVTVDAPAGTPWVDVIDTVERQLGHDITVIEPRQVSDPAEAVRRQREFYGSELPENFHVEEMPAMAALRLLAEQMWPENDPDAVVNLGPEGLSLNPLLPPWAAGPSSRLVYMYDVHDLLAGDAAAEREAALLRTISSSLPMYSGDMAVQRHSAVYDGVLSVRVTETARDSIEQTLIMLRQAREALGELPAVEGAG